MNINENKGLIISIIGIILTISIYGIFFGVPLTIIGVYLLNKKSHGKDLEEKLRKKQEELDNIDKKLADLEAEKSREIDEKLDDKNNQLKNLDEEYKKKEELKKEELNKNINSIQKELDNLDAKYKELESSKQKHLDSKLKTKQEELDNLEDKYEKLKITKEKELTSELIDKQTELEKILTKIKENKEELGSLEDEVEIQSYGLYAPRYKFVHAVDYKNKLDEIRRRQKQMIKNKTAAVCYTEWEIGGDKRVGKAATNDNIKQVLRTFNLETEIIISKVKHSNIDSSKKRIRKSFDQLNKLNKRWDLNISVPYLNLKLDELNVAYEYEVKKQEEKELLREAREKEREEKKLKKELDREKKKFNKENDKINSEIEKIKEKLAKVAAEEKAKYESEIKKLQEALDKNNGEIKKIDEWKEKPGAGYVYIISNIGSFGKDIFKIGVTRRDNPEDRIRELSSASVPFRYDAHVFIFSKDAYALEKELHNRFDKKRVNKVNMRKEFFKISMDDVKQIVEENKGAVHSFVEHPDAEEYYDTLKIEKSMT